METTKFKESCQSQDLTDLYILKDTHSLILLQMNVLGALLKVTRAKTFSSPFYFLSVSYFSWKVQSFFRYLKRQNYCHYQRL